MLLLSSFLSQVFRSVSSRVLLFCRRFVSTLLDDVHFVTRCFWLDARMYVCMIAGLRLLPLPLLSAQRILSYRIAVRVTGHLSRHRRQFRDPICDLVSLVEAMWFGAVRCGAVRCVDGNRLSARSTHHSENQQELLIELSLEGTKQAMGFLADDSRKRLSLLLRLLLAKLRRQLLLLMSVLVRPTMLKE